MVSDGAVKVVDRLFSFLIFNWITGPWGQEGLYGESQLLEGDAAMVPFYDADDEYFGPLYSLDFLEEIETFGTADHACEDAGGANATWLPQYCIRAGEIEMAEGMCWANGGAAIETYWRKVLYSPRAALGYYISDGKYIRGGMGLRFGLWQAIVTTVSTTTLRCTDHTGPPFLIETTEAFFEPADTGRTITIEANPASHWTGGSYILTYVSSSSANLTVDPTDGKDTGWNGHASIRRYTNAEEVAYLTADDWAFVFFLLGVQECKNDEAPTYTNPDRDRAAYQEDVLAPGKTSAELTFPLIGAQELPQWALTEIVPAISGLRRYLLELMPQNWLLHCEDMADGYIEVRLIDYQREPKTETTILRQSAEGKTLKNGMLALTYGGVLALIYDNMTDIRVATVPLNRIPTLPPAENTNPAEEDHLLVAGYTVPAAKYEDKMNVWHVIGYQGGNMYYLQGLGGNPTEVTFNAPVLIGPADESTPGIERLRQGNLVVTYRYSDNPVRKITVNNGRTWTTWF